MKSKNPTDPKPTGEYELIVDSHGPWANEWHPAWDSAAPDQSNSRNEGQEKPPDQSLATKSPGSSSTPPEEKRD